MSINEKQYEYLVKQLHSVEVPENWGQIQNNKTDDRINLFNINSYQELYNTLEENALLQYKDYYVRRWCIIKCELCDRYLFSKHKGKVVDNPNPYDQEYDFKIDGVKLDLKSTRIPKKLICNHLEIDKFYNVTNEEYREAIKYFVNHPEELIQFYYDEQSVGRRYSIHNRLFFVTADLTSIEDYDNEFNLRLNFNAKDYIITKYIDSFNKDSLREYEIRDKKNNQNKNIKAHIIFLYKDEDKKLYYTF